MQAVKKMTLTAKRLIQFLTKCRISQSMHLINPMLPVMLLLLTEQRILNAIILLNLWRH